MSTLTAARRSAHLSSSTVTASRSGLLVAAFFYLVVAAMLSELWKAAAEANGGAVAGYSATALVWYIATSEAVTIPLPMRLMEDIGDDITNDTYAIELLRPVSPLVVRISGQIGAMLPRLAACVTVGSVLALLSGGRPVSVLALALAVPSMLLALVLNLVTQHAFAASAFWVRDTKGTWFLYQKLVFVTGGMLLPLEVLPDALETICRWLPFMAMAYAPARLASGHVEPALLAIQLGWLIVLGLLTRRLFAAGQRRLIGGAP